MSIISKPFFGKDASYPVKIIVKPYSMCVIKWISQSQSGGFESNKKDVVLSYGSISIEDNVIMQRVTTHYKQIISYYDTLAQISNGRLINLSRFIRNGSEIKMYMSYYQDAYGVYGQVYTLGNAYVENGNYIKTSQSTNVWTSTTATADDEHLTASLVGYNDDGTSKTVEGCFTYISSGITEVHGTISYASTGVRFDKVTIDGTEIPVEILTTWEDPT